MSCRHCKSSLSLKFLDLGFQPPSNAYLTEKGMNAAEITYPLRVNVCSECWLVQTEDYVNETEFFSPEYAYFSSTSKTWLNHAREYCEKIRYRFDLDETKRVIEVASNDGYLLKNFIKMGIPCFGIEPTDSTADVAEKANIPTIREFFGEKLAHELVEKDQAADLIIGNNVYAHVPDINDFTSGLQVVLKPQGIITLEFPHVMRLVEFNQFDTVYHEHFSYLSLFTVNRIFKKNGLRIFDVEELNTHGGSIRVYGCRQEATHQQTNRVDKLLEEEQSRGMQTEAFYEGFQSKIDKIKDELLEFLIEKKKRGKKVAAYGAAAKGNTLLNYAGVKPDMIPFVCDAAVAKQGKYLPGSHIPVFAPDKLESADIDYLLILPWNIAPEIKRQNEYLAGKNVKFVTAIPELKII